MFLDYRSDTVTKPTTEMRQAMAVADVGDDVYGEDPTVNELEAYAASLVGKEAAVFVPSCSMANLIAVSVHCKERFSEYIVGHKQHLHLYECGGVSSLANVHSNLLQNNEFGELPLEEVKKAIREPDVHHPITQLVSIENPHNSCGGRVLTLDYIQKLSTLAKEHQIKVHMDGARFFNAVAALSNTSSSPVSPAQICRSVDSLSICLSKGLCAPVGALLVGDTPFITKARHVRKALGGGMRQAGVLAACGLIALKQLSVPDRLLEDHLHAKKLAKGVTAIRLKNRGGAAKNSTEQVFDIWGGIESIETNMFYCKVKDNKAQEVIREMKKNHGVLLDDGYGTDLIRVVTHKDVDISKADYVIDAFTKVARSIFR